MAVLYHVPTSRSLRVLWVLEERRAQAVKADFRHSLRMLGSRSAAYRQRLLSRPAFRRALSVE